jgi:hypothetical protein
VGDEFFSKAWIEDGRIVVYRFASTGAEAAELWFKEITSLFDHWNDEKPLLLLIDLSEPDNQLSAEMLRSAREASKERPDVPGRTAVIIDSSEPTQNVKLLLDRVLAETRERKLFDKEADAIAWLLEG